ncbi:MAG: hypothetical protein WDZ42_00980 [Candidatus Saccharimonadales bacterium]
MIRKSRQKKQQTPNSVKAQRPRPYWHVDMKWVSGILSLILIFATLLVFSFWRLSSPENAIEISTLAIASVFSPDGLDATADIEALLEEFNEDEDVIYPLEGMDFVSITRTDIEELSPRELRLKIFNQIVEPLYYEGAEELATRVTDDQEEIDSFVNDASLVSGINHDTHLKSRNILIVLIIASLASLISLIYFSHRFGKIVSPSLVTLFATIPAALPVLFLSGMASGDGSTDQPGRAGTVIGEVAPLIVSALMPTMLALLAVSLLGLIVAGVLRAWKGKLDYSNSIGISK